MRLILLFILVHISAFGQYGQNGARILPSVLQASFPEQQSLAHIAKNQEKVREAAEDIAYKTAALYVLKEKYYQSLKNVDPELEDALIVQELKDIVLEVVDYKKLTSEIAGGDAELTLMSAEAMIRIVEEAYDNLKDMLIALKAGQENLMSSTDRLDFLEELKDQLYRLRETAFMILTTVEYMNGYLKIDESFNIDKQKYIEIYDNAFKQYELFFEQ